MGRGIAGSRRVVVRAADGDIVPVVVVNGGDGGDGYDDGDDVGGLTIFIIDALLVLDHSCGRRAQQQGIGRRRLRGRASDK